MWRGHGRQRRWARKRYMPACMATSRGGRAGAGVNASPTAAWTTDGLRLFVGELEAPFRRGVRLMGLFWCGVQVPDQAGRRRRARAHRRRRSKSRTSCASLGVRERSTAHNTRINCRWLQLRCRWDMVQAAAMPCWTVSTRGTGRGGLSRYMALSFAPDPDCSFALREMRISTSCCGSRPIRSSSSPSACGRTSTRPTSTQPFRLQQRDRRYGGIPTEELCPRHLSRCSGSGLSPPSCCCLAGAGAVRAAGLPSTADLAADRCRRLEWARLNQIACQPRWAWVSRWHWPVRPRWLPAGR